MGNCLSPSADQGSGSTADATAKANVYRQAPQQSSENGVATAKRPQQSPASSPGPKQAAGKQEFDRLSGVDGGKPAAAPTLPATSTSASTAAAAPKRYARLRTDCKVRDVYRLGRTLGTGGFSVVKLGIEKKSGKEYACKIMALPPAGAEVGENENTREDIFKEIDILCGLNHENVIFLKEFFEEGNKVYLITELLTGGELLDAVLQRGTYSEKEARMCFVQLLRGIEYLHSKNVVHRDLKLENLLLTTHDDITRVKIADFGLAKKIAGDGMQTICGTPQYVAPEIIVGAKGHEYGPGVDMWSAGVVLFILLGGYPPFWSDSEPQLFEQIRKGKFSFNDPVWDGISESAKDLIRKLLVVDPKKRISATQALQHPWLREALNKEAVLRAAQQNMRRHFRRRFKAVVGSVIAANRLKKALGQRNEEESRRMSAEVPSSQTPDLQTSPPSPKP